MTYSIVALDRETGELGVGVQTHRPTVGAVVPWVEPGIGAVATQSRANVAFGRQALELMKTGLSAQSAMHAILAGDSDPSIRQVGIIDSSGGTASHTGDNCITEFGSVQGDGFSAQANMMLNPGVPEAMAEIFTASKGALVDRILDALDAAEAVGGDIRGRQSVGIYVAAPPAGPGSESVGVPPSGIWDLRIDNSPETLVDVRNLKNTIQAEMLLRSDGANASLAGANSAYAAALALAPTDELTFWFGVRNLVISLDDNDSAEEVLKPLLSQKSNWLELLHRLRELPQGAEILNRFPRP
jgi:uncharacterized Ntn-hydrolase superfamily protein